MTDNRPDLRTVYRLPENPPEVQKVIDKGMAELERSVRPKPQAKTPLDAVWFFGGVGIICLSLFDQASYHLTVLGAAVMGLPVMGNAARPRTR